jgi:alpha-N-arabinofuranosidase
MNPTTLTLHTQFKIGEVDPRIFGGFLEHMGRAVYEGVYEPNSIHADEMGCRKDVLGALRRLGYTAMRYPGGNYASGFHWMDGVGPKNARPTVRELAWQSIETNQFGTDEFIALSRKMDWVPMLTVNLGTGTPEEARNWVEYCNAPAGTKYADMRARNGNREPFGVNLWCLGNEMDGPWQLGHVPADQYAIRAQQAAKMMKDTDKTIETVACGTCSLRLPTYMEWDRTVLEHIGDYADYISLHRYVGNPHPSYGTGENTSDYLAITNSIDQQIEEMDAVCRFVQAKRRSKKRTYLCFDEWNVWYKNRQMDGEGKFAPHLIEEVYNLEDALVVAGFLNSFVRHADCVKIANIAQIVNVIAPILTQGDDMLIQSIFYPIEMMSKRRSGTSLRVVVAGPHYDSAVYGTVTFIDSSAILGHDATGGLVLHVFATNRSQTEPALVRVNVADRALNALINGEIVTGPEPKTANSYAQPNLVVAQPFNTVTLANGQAEFVLPPLSFAALSFKIVG